MIYIVEDDLNIRELEEYALKNSGYEVKGFEKGSDMYAALIDVIPQLIILDIMLPGENGLKILEKLRSGKETKRIPVIMVTAKTTELDKVKGLDSGADDYIAKPFGILELVSRVKALLRRTQPEETPTQFSIGKLVLSDSKHQVLVDGEGRELTFKEYELLKYLMANEGIVLSRDKIMNQVWGFDFEGESRTVDMHIKTLRKKLEPVGEYIKTVRNVGYKIEPVRETGEL